MIVLIGILTAAAAGLATAAQPAKYQQNSSLLLSLRDSKTLADYDFDQFYTLQAADLYASNIVSWMNSAEVNETIRNQAGSEEGRIRAKRTGGTVELTGVATSAQSATALVNSATALITDRTKTLSAGANRASFEIVPRPLGAEIVRPRLVQGGIAGLLAGLLLGFAVALVRQAGAKR